ncbi:MAG TPA: kelch repeat-containing protein [Chthoniobacterales bacterium]|nr:kelch repeat-containing protein [Chthoniobacterales bacterium]
MFKPKQGRLGQPSCPFSPVPEPSAVTLTVLLHIGIISPALKNSFPPFTVISVIHRFMKNSTLLLVAALSLCTVRPTHADPAGTLITPRWNHTATLLLDGRVLVAGGYVQVSQCCFNPTDTCEIYDPASNSWTPTGSLSVARESHSAVLLADGRVLVTGGQTLGDSPQTVEIYDPATGRWTLQDPIPVLPGGNLVLLADGRVLAPGGVGKQAAKCEVYNPETGRWPATGSLNIPRSGFQATRLNDGRVLAVGGVSPTMPGFIRQCELYDPITGTWSLSGTLNQSHGSQSQVLLPDGRVMIAGGVVGPACCADVTRIVEIFDPNTGAWTVSHPLTTPRADFTASLLSDGNVFAAGGYNGVGTTLPLDSIEEFETATGRWHLLAKTLATARLAHTATTLLDGSVLIAGGYGNAGQARPVANAEIFVTPH